MLHCLSLFLKQSALFSANSLTSFQTLVSIICSNIYIMADVFLGNKFCYSHTLHFLCCFLYILLCICFFLNCSGLFFLTIFFEAFFYLFPYCFELSVQYFFFYFHFFSFKLYCFTFCLHCQYYSILN